MKKLISVILVCTYFLCFIGCSEKETVSEKNISESIAESTMKNESELEDVTTDDENNDSHDVIKIGQTAEMDNWKITLSEVKEYSKISGDYNMEYTPEKEGNIFITVYFEVENLDSKENFFNLGIYSKFIVDGESAEPVFTAMPEKTNNFSMGCNIPEKEKMTGGITYEVPADWQYAGIAYSKNFDTENYLLFGIYNYDVTNEDKISDGNLINNNEEKQNSETTENTTVKDFDVEEFKNQADDVFVNSIGQECYIIKSDGAIAFNVFLDTSKDDDDIIEQIMLGITLCWSNYCTDNYSLMSFMFFDLDGNNICYYTITNMLGKFSDLGNDITWTDKYKQYQEVHNNSVYKDHLKIFKPEN